MQIMDFKLQVLPDLGTTRHVLKTSSSVDNMKCGGIYILSLARGMQISSLSAAN